MEIHAEAFEEYREGLCRQPNHKPARFNVGVILQGKEDFHGAIDAYHAVLSLEPDDAMAHYNLGLALKHTGDLDEAIEHYQAGLATQPDYALLHYELGEARAQQGETRQAAQAFDTYLRLEQDGANNRQRMDRAQQFLAATADTPTDKIAEVDTTEEPTGEADDLHYLDEDQDD